jgi:hypothetical protein
MVYQFHTEDGVIYKKLTICEGDETLDMDLRRGSYLDLEIFGTVP